MAGPISGPGIGLPLPQNLYPSELNNAPYDAPTNRIALAPGESWVVPRGDWMISLGLYLTLQYLDPVTNTWHIASSEAYNRGAIYVRGDGFNIRVANLLGCPVIAVVAALGSNYVQASTTITQTPGNGTWVPVVGGALAVSGGTLVSNGAGYGVAPIVLIPAPPGPTNNANGVGGVQATAWAAIASGTVSGVTLNNPGAGYPSAPTAVIVPSPFDPNLATGITQATVAFSLTGAGQIRAAFCTNSGAPLANPNQVTLALAGAGSSGSLVACALQTVTAASVSGVGTGFGTVSALLTTMGGVPPQGSIAGPSSLYLTWLPRPAQVGLTVTAAGTIGTQLGAIYDGGLFLTNTAPNFSIAGQPFAQATVTAAPTLALTMGGVPDIALVQPLG
jgi:hypothetical protein